MDFEKCPVDLMSNGIRLAVENLILMKINVLKTAIKPSTCSVEQKMLRESVISKRLKSTLLFNSKSINNAAPSTIPPRPARN